MQFKQFPVGFAERIVGRAVHGFSPTESIMANPFGAQARHVGTLLAGATMVGYLSMVAKDIIKGYWPPRDPSDPRVLLAALQQGGALGIYGDFLFSKVNRYGGGLTETAAGPAIGSIAGFANIILDARDAALAGNADNFSKAQAFSTLVGNTPGANLYWVKPAVDYLWLNATREALSPGYLRRMERNRKKEYNQTRLWPQTIQGQ
jgi:hypothetical protein